MNCKICSSKKIDIIGEIYDYEYNLDEKARYLKCLKCKTIFRNKISFTFATNFKSTFILNKISKLSPDKAI